MIKTRRRVSYIIPPPSESIPRLQLPPHGVSRLGATGPLLTPFPGQSVSNSKGLNHPRHRLGVASLALDTSTQLVGRATPGGILYSGGRDGLVMAWELGIPMKRRKVKAEQSIKGGQGRWEIMTGWGDDIHDEDLEDGDERVNDGDVLGDVTENLHRRRLLARSKAGEIPYERQWETDMSIFEAGTPTHFRQSVQAHTDWVNDILLCNYNQTVVSASSDGTVKAWSPHASSPTDPSTVGSHSDYVRCLTYCREQNWVASGSFDRTIKLWDLNHTTTDALVTLNPPDATAPKSSVYALAADPFGRTIASGSPERVIRLWDPRTGKRTGKLVGHTDNLRAILISEDSKYLLTGSADASIKLWSLSSQRCLHTFTHHTESVWSLFSDHPCLEIFYSGDRSGLVSRVDVAGCSDISDGECAVLCHDSLDSMKPSCEGINKIVVMDDNLLWTASGTSTIRRWNIPQRRSLRISPQDSDGERLPSAKPRRPTLTVDVPSEAGTRPRRLSFSPSVQSLSSEHFSETGLNGLPYESLVKLVSPNDPFTSYTANRIRDPEVATLYSAASVMSVPHQIIRSSDQPLLRTPTRGNPLQSSRTEDTVMAYNTERMKYDERELAADAVPLCSKPDDVIPGDHGLVRCIILSNRVNALTVDTAGEVAVWDIVRGICQGRYLPEDVATASLAGSTAGGSDEKERGPREALEIVRERIEGEAVVSTWCSADTKAGVLTIHMTERCFEAEVYADEVGFAHDRHFNDESKLNIGKWVLRNLFIGFVREEQRRHSQDGTSQPSLSRAPSQDVLDLNTPNRLPSSLDPPKSPTTNTVNNGTVVSSFNMIPAVPPTVSPTARSSPLITPLIPLHHPWRDSALPSIPQSPMPMQDVLLTPIPIANRRTRSGTIDNPPASASALPTPNGLKDDDFTTRTRLQSLQGGSMSASDEFSGWSGPNKQLQEPQTPSTPSGIMGRLKNFGKIAKRPVSEVANIPTPESATTVVGTAVPALENEVVQEVPKTAVQQLLLSPIKPPTSNDAPLYLFPLNTTVLISAEASPSYTTVYRGTVSTTHSDVDALEKEMPLWLAEYLFLNQTPPLAPLAKLSFVLVPWNKDPDVEPLPELLNATHSKLTASRYLRIRKIVYHVQDKLDRIQSGSKAGSLRSSVDSQTQFQGQIQAKASRSPAEDIYEILCNDMLLPYEMTLAAVRQYVWRQGTELVMHYRRKRAPPQG